jgi:hypothetical protein
MGLLKIQIELMVDITVQQDFETLTRLPGAISYLLAATPPLNVTVGISPSVNSSSNPTLSPVPTAEASPMPNQTVRPARLQVVNAKKVLRRCSSRVQELVAAAAAAFPPVAEFSLEELADKIRTDPNVQALTPTLRAHPKATTDLVGAMVSWRRNLSRPEKRIGSILLERVDGGESPARYCVAAGVPQALHELANPMTPTN